MFVIASTGMMAQNKFTFSGQLSGYIHFNPDNNLPLWGGGRYIPRLNYEISLKEQRKVDFEASANIYGNAGLRPFDSTGFNGDIKPYRAWIRYSSSQFEIRAGLQKINFGSAKILRPLMWFDRIDPRDPLQLTDGVWGILARYYFLNNTNIWIWGLWGNKETRGWEAFPTAKNNPEFGGRAQVPVPRGEAAFSYHHRTADCSQLSDSNTIVGNVIENRFGLDARFDMVVGWWVEASWSLHNDNIGAFTNQEAINAGIDYTFGIGNGLGVTFEQLLTSLDEEPFQFKSATTFSLLSLSYPIGLFDQISAMVYYDWTNNRLYNFLNWQRQFNRVTLYTMFYLNPKEYYLPLQESSEMLYAGTGIMLMVVFNH
jgi:hypothetical protein